MYIDNYLSENFFDADNSETRQLMNRIFNPCPKRLRFLIIRGINALYVKAFALRENLQWTYDAQVKKYDVY
jgi:hypothetical protein